MGKYPVKKYPEDFGGNAGFEPWTPKGNRSGLYPSCEPLRYTTSNQKGRRDVTDAQIRLVRKLDGNVD